MSANVGFFMERPGHGLHWSRTRSLSMASSSSDEPSSQPLVVHRLRLGTSS